jgi:hypothetical protein
MWNALPSFSGLHQDRSATSFLDELVKFCDEKRLSLNIIRLEPQVTEVINAVSAQVRIPLGRYDKYVEFSHVFVEGVGPAKSPS